MLFKTESFFKERRSLLIYFMPKRISRNPRRKTRDSTATAQIDKKPFIDLCEDLGRRRTNSIRTPPNKTICN
jgi:hypothetical protein